MAKTRFLPVFFAAVLSVCVNTVALSASVYAEAPEAHHLAFASDYHSVEGSIRNAMSGMPEDTEYVSLIGDMAGEWGNFYPEYDSGEILELVGDVFPDLDSSSVSIVWATHDRHVNDEGTGIVKCMNGVSEPIREGTNEDGSPAYFIYGIGHYDMTKGGAASADAAAAFKQWIDGIGHTIPVIVLCHVPIQASRGDNNGASYWNEALNYAATGVEGITTTGTSADIIRNVLFLHGHNHTNDPTEYYYGAGTEMSVQTDRSSEEDAPGGGRPPFVPGESGGERPPFTSGGFDGERPPFTPGGSGGERPPFTPGESGGERPPFVPGHGAEGVLSDIYYTSLTAGYLKTSGNAALVTVNDGALTLTKYNGGQTVSLGTDGVTNSLMGESITIAAQETSRRSEAAEQSTYVPGTETAASPQTGDSSLCILWFTLLCLSLLSLEAIREVSVHL